MRKVQLARAFRPGLAKSNQVKRHPDQYVPQGLLVAVLRCENLRDEQENISDSAGVAA